MTPNFSASSPANDRIRHLLRQMIRNKEGTFAPLPRSLIASCLHSHDIHLLGALNTLLDMPDHVGRISPALEFRSLFTFKMRYCERCITDNPKSEWADERFTAGWDFSKWFLKQFHKKRFQPSDLMLFRQWLTQFFHKSPAPIRQCITQTLLADILREKEIRILLSDWEKLTPLQEAFQAALSQKSRFLESI